MVSPWRAAASDAQVGERQAMLDAAREARQAEAQRRGELWFEMERRRSLGLQEQEEKEQVSEERKWEPLRAQQLPPSSVVMAEQPAISQDLADFLAAHGLQHFADVLGEQGITSVKRVRYLSEGDLRELGLTMRERSMLREALAKRAERVDEEQVRAQQAVTSSKRDNTLSPAPPSPPALPPPRVQPAPPTAPTFSSARKQRSKADPSRLRRATPSLKLNQQSKAKPKHFTFGST